MDKNRRKGKRIYQIIALVCGVLCLCCIVWIVAYLIGQKRAEAELEAMRDAYISQENNTADEPDADTYESGNHAMSEKIGENETESGEGTPEKGDMKEEFPPEHYGITDKKVDIAALKEEVNQDIYAWIYVPGTVIDYPVLQHPEEMDYYLEYNIDGTKGRPGCIYTQRMNSKDWTDPNTVLYGHNMRVGTMFADLHKFEDEDFFEENRYIHIYTEDGRILVYEIFAAYVTGNEHLLLTYPIYTEEGFQSYLDGIFENTGKGCHFLEDRELTAEDRIITLSTCVYGQSDKRYLVQGVLVAEKEQK